MKAEEKRESDSNGERGKLAKTLEIFQLDHWETLRGNWRAELVLTLRDNKEV